jgi:hypothetical protein
MAELIPPVPTSAIYPSFQTGFTYNGNTYSMSFLLLDTSADDSSDLETVISGMMSGLGEAYTDVFLYEFAMTETVLI